MTICPNCGAGNKPGSSVCRMCGDSLQESKPARESQADSDHDLPPTIVVSEQQRNQEGAASNDPQGVACPKCQTLNEAGWSFCQQCGTRLPKMQPPEPPRPPAEHKSPEGFKTVPTETPSKAPAEPEPVAQGLKTVVATPAVTKPEDKQNKPAAPPQEHRPVAPRPAPPPERLNRPAGPATVVAEPPVRKPSMPMGERQAPPQRQAPPTEQVQSSAASAEGGEVACPQCGHMNSTGSAFCGSCGAVMTVAKTVVMASPLAAVKGKLHLVMEGGQSGDVYEIDEETIIGRAGGDITFPHDGFMSGRHARIIRRGNSFVLTDEGSRNGTFVKIKGEVELKPGDMILVGKQLFRFEV
jgi:phage FluMu protein Com